MGSHKNAIATAAIEVLSQKGSRGFTHRAIDHCAGLPSGTTSRYARSRGALFALAADALFESDLVVTEQGKQNFAENRAETAGDVVKMLLNATLALLCSPKRYRARLELQLEASRSKTLEGHFRTSRAVFVDRVATTLSRLDVETPEHHADVLITMIDGVLHRQIILEAPKFSIEELEHLLGTYVIRLASNSQSNA